MQTHDQDNETPVGSPRESPEKTAIIGIGCRLPGEVNSASSFWQLLTQKRETITPIPPNRYDIEALYNPEPQTPGAVIQREGGYLNDVDQFDASFFEISPREAMYMDPQQRFLLEVAWEAFADAGIPQNRLTGTHTGVFIGQWTSDYEARMYRSLPHLEFHATTGGGRYSAAGRLSFAFDLRGPCLVLDTACSSSLVAIHLASQSLQNGESELALAGGVNLILAPQVSMAYSYASMLSPNSRCRFADAQADGFVRSEGVGLLVLKPLSRAIADGDRIYAIISGSAVNNDGRGSGLLVKPAIAGQIDMLREACQHAGIKPSQLGYVECHGTGTPAGDPVELTALGTLIGPSKKSAPLLVGSVKTNIGHTESAAGATGLIKASLALYHSQIPASLHHHHPSPQIAWNDLNLSVPTTLTPWPHHAETRYAGVSSFGITGTNAHIVLENPPPVAAIEAMGGDVCHLLTLSAHDHQALRATVESWVTFLQHAPRSEMDLGTICYNANVRQSALPCRMAVTGTSFEEIVLALQARADEMEGVGLEDIYDEVPDTKLAFICSGQGPKFWPLDHALLTRYKVFRDTLAQCDQLLQDLGGWSLLDKLSQDLQPSDLEQTEFAQPALCAIQIALAALLRSWGIQPQAVIGHSMGEVAAAHISGALSLEDTMRVIWHRGRLQQTRCGMGKMAFVALPPMDVEAYLQAYDGLSIGAVNSPSSTIISGDPEAIDHVVCDLERAEVFSRVLASVDFASHSHQMDPICAPMTEAVKDIAPSATLRTLYSTVEAQAIDGVHLGPQYWADNIRQPVRFAETLEQLVRDGYTHFLEIGAHPVLSQSVMQCLRTSGVDGEVIASLNHDLSAPEALLSSVGQLYQAGFDIDFSPLHTVRPVVSLPHYAWQRETYWFAEEAPESRSVTPRPPSVSHPFELRQQSCPNSALEQWRVRIPAATCPGLFAHRLRHLTICPGGFLCEIILAVAQARLGNAPPLLRDIVFKEAVILQEGEDLALLATLSETADGYQVAIQSQDGHTVHVEGCLTTQPLSTAARESIDECVAACDEVLTPDQHYQALRLRDIRYHAELQSIQKIERGPHVAVSVLSMPSSTVSVEPEYVAHPVVVDACFQTLVAALGRVVDNPCVVQEVATFARHCAAQPDTAYWIHATIEQRGPQHFVGQVVLRNTQGEAIWELQDVTLSLLAHDLDRFSYRLHWQASPSAIAPLSGCSQRPWMIVAPAPRNPIVAHLCTHLETVSVPYTVLTSDAEGDAPWHQSEGLHVVLIAPEQQVLSEDRLDDTIDRVGETLWSATRDWLRRCGRATHLDRMWLITTGVYSTETDAPNLLHAPLWGMGRSMALEHPSFACHILDLHPDAEPVDCARTVYSEVVGNTDEIQIAYLNQTRHVARLQPAQGHYEQNVKLNANGTYLITGGLGGLGLAVADAMIDAGARHLVLTSRSGLPSREVWPALSSDDPRAHQVQAMLAMEARGARVSIYAGDVADKDDMTDLFERSLSLLPPLRGVIHAAGVVAPNPIATMSHDEFNHVTTSKIQGAWLLHQMVGSRPLDFFVMFSSVASMLGAMHYAHYAAGNTFMDVLARYRTGQGLPALSLNWGPWNHVGLGNTETRTAMTQAGMLPLAPLTATQAFIQVLQCKTGQLMLAQVDWQRFGPIYQAKTKSPFLEHLPLPCLHAEQQMAAPKTTPQEQVRSRQRVTPGKSDVSLQSTVRALVAQALGLNSPSRVGPQGFTQQGMDSLMAAELARQLSVAVGQSIPPAVIFDYPTVETLTTYLATLVPQASETPEADHSETEATALPESAPVERAPSVSHRSLRATVLDELGVALGIKPSSRMGNRTFVQLGMDSLLAADFARRLSQQLSLPQPLPTAALFEYPNMDTLIDYLQAQGAEPVSNPAPSIASVDSATNPAAPPLSPMTRAEASPQAVAVVGMACRFPGDIDNPTQLWQALLEGRDVISEVPPERFDIDVFYDPDPSAVGKICTRYGAF